MRTKRHMTVWLMAGLILSLVAPQAGRAARQPDASPPAAQSFSMTEAGAPDMLSLRTRFEPALFKQLFLAADDQWVRGIVQMRSPEVNWDMLVPMEMDVLSRRRAVIAQLENTAQIAQRDILSDLAIAQSNFRVQMFKSLWIINGVVVEGKKQVFWELAARPDVALILQDHQRYVPQEQLQPLTAKELTHLDAVQWNVQRVQAERVWQGVGITGEGVVVASMDTGVDWQHPALQTRYRGYTGKPFANHLGNWYCVTSEGYAYPGDGMGHGTHVTGIMVGQGGIGVAPGAQWIAVKAFSNQGVGYDSWIHDGFQWLLAPAGNPALAPDVVNNSWGNDNGSLQVFDPDIRALQAAGIVVIFSAGNKGPGSGTVSSPGSLSAAFAVGATDDTDLIARFSGRGPSLWGQIKPEVSAPGVDIVSSLPGGSWGKSSGTSMAAPHVSGLVALMRQVAPSLTPAQIGDLLMQTAQPLGEPRPNNVYGWGLADGYAAVVQAGQLGRLAGRVTDAITGGAVPTATLQVVLRGGDLTVTTQTDSSGWYQTGLAAGNYDVTVTAFGYVPTTRYGLAITTGVTTTLDVALSPLPTGTLQGVVRQAGTGTPLAAQVSVPGMPAVAQSDAGSGQYQLILPQGTHTVRVQAWAHRVATATVTVNEGSLIALDFNLETAPTILLVDSGAWYNNSQREFWQAALDELGYLYDLHVVARLDASPAGVPTTTDLLSFDLVIWSAPQDSPAFIGAGQVISDYLGSGGRLLLSGQDVAFWDAGGTGAFYDPYLVRQLKVMFVQDAASSRVLQGNGLMAGLTITLAGGSGADNQFFPDVIASSNEDVAVSLWQYENDGSGGQQVGPCLPYRAVFFSFGWEGIGDAATRREVLQRSIAWLDSPPQASGLELKPLPPLSPVVARPGHTITHMVRLRNTGESTALPVALSLAGHNWPTHLMSAPFLSLGICQTQTIQVSATIPPDQGWHVQDTAILTATASALSAVISLTAKTPAPVLLVDGSRFFDMQAHYKDALEQSGIFYDVHRIKKQWPLNVPSDDQLSMYPLVVWYTAYDWYRPIGDEEEARLLTYLGGGGRVFLSSQDLLYYKHDTALARDFLGVWSYTEDLSATVALGEMGHPVGWGLGPYTLTYPYNNWSDSLVPTGEAGTAWRNQRGLPIGLTRSSEADWRTSFWSFPFETLDADAAAQAMQRTVGWLSWLGRSNWAPEQATVAAGQVVTMSGVLRNDGWADMSSAHFSLTLPAALTLHHLGAGLSYDALRREVSWQGGLARGAALTLSVRLQVTDTLSGASFVALPARVGYDDHHIAFDLPAMLRVNAPDLTCSILQVEPQTGSPSRTLTYTLTLCNGGSGDAVVTVSAVRPEHARLVGDLDSGGLGLGSLISRSLIWTGTVMAGSTVTLRYRAELDGAGDYVLHHQARLADQHEQVWLLDRWTWVSWWKQYLPLIFRQATMP